MRRTQISVAMVFALVVTGAVQAETLRVVGFNVESGGSFLTTR